jgi:hypothetical protein
VCVLGGGIERGMGVWRVLVFFGGGKGGISGCWVCVFVGVGV